MYHKKSCMNWFSIEKKYLQFSENNQFLNKLPVIEVNHFSCSTNQQMAQLELKIGTIFSDKLADPIQDENVQVLQSVSLILQPFWIFVWDSNRVFLNILHGKWIFHSFFHLFHQLMEWLNLDPILDLLEKTLTLRSLTTL